MSRLKDLRTAAGLTQQGLADRAGISIRLVQKYEAGTCSIQGMTLATAKALADALGVKIEDLF